MKKNIILTAAVAVLAIVGLSACGGNKKCGGNACENSKLNEEQMFSGVLPAADGPGIRYLLKLDYDDDKNFTEGDYDLVETYLAADSTSVGGVRDGEMFKSEGDFTVMNQNGKKYLKLVKDIKDSNAKASDNLYFEVVNDSTLTLVNSNLEPAVNDSLNYTLRLVK